MSFIAGCVIGGTAGVVVMGALCAGAMADRDTCIYQLNEENQRLKRRFLELGHDHRITHGELDYYDLACMAGSMTPERRN